MAQTVKIISDSTCDLSKELVEKYDITILPLHILLGEDEYRDGVDITPEEIFRWSDENKTTPKTSAPSLTEAMEVMQPFVEEGREIICFSISDSMSTSGNVMRLAAEELEASDKVTVINSANLSTGIGLQVIQAAILASEGKTAAEITTAIEAIRPKVRASFVVDTLTYLHRGGRCSGSGRWYVKASSPDRRGGWCHGCLQKIPWKTGFRHPLLHKGYGRGSEECRSRQSLHHPLRLRPGDCGSGSFLSGKSGNL